MFSSIHVLSRITMKYYMNTLLVILVEFIIFVSKFHIGDNEVLLYMYIININYLKIVFNYYE